MYLQIRNKGLVDHRCLSILGIGTARYSNNKNTIGIFGSGSKHSIALCLRKGIRPIICSGSLKMEFYTKPEFVGENQFNRVCVRYSGDKNSSEELGFATEFGASDWKNLDNAYREFVSNAIDGSLASGGTHSDVEFEVVQKPRAKTGYTSIFLPYTPEIERCHIALSSQFLHFSGKDIGQKFLEKSEDDTDTIIYKKGVRVAFLPKTKSVFNYNLGDELKLDESRNANDWDVKYAIARAIKYSNTQVISNILKKIVSNGNLYENTLESSYISATTYDKVLNNKEYIDRKTNYQGAFKEVFGNRAALVRNGVLSDFVKAKGYKPVVIVGPWADILESYEVPCDSVILTTNEKEGRIELPVSEEQQNALDWAWDIVAKHNMMNGQDKPILKSFRSLMDGNTSISGFCDLAKNEVWLHADGGGKDLKITAMHEIVHHCTKSLDCSLDYQDFCLRLLILTNS